MSKEKNHLNYKVILFWHARSFTKKHLPLTRKVLIITSYFSIYMSESWIQNSNFIKTLCSFYLAEVNVITKKCDKTLFWKMLMDLICFCVCENDVCSTKQQVFEGCVWCDAFDTLLKICSWFLFSNATTAFGVLWLRSVRFCRHWSKKNGLENSKQIERFESDCSTRLNPSLASVSCQFECFIQWAKEVRGKCLLQCICNNSTWCVCVQTNFVWCIPN